MNDHTADRPAGQDLPRLRHCPPELAASRAGRWRALGTSAISGRAGKQTVTLMPLGAAIDVAGAPPRALPTGVRGPIRGLSARSGRRLVSRLIGIELPSCPFTVHTLTYHRERPGTPLDWHRDLRAFAKRMRRAFAFFEPGITWIKEFQRRGTVHYHLIVTWKREPPVAGLDRWIRDNWTALVEPGDVAAWKHGTKTTRGYLKDKGGRTRLACYLTSYFRKHHQKHPVDRETGEYAETGRMWGQEGDVAAGEPEVYELNDAELDVFLFRLARSAPKSRYLDWLAGARCSGIAYGGPDEIRKLLAGLGRLVPPRAPPTALLTP